MHLTKCYILCRLFEGHFLFLGPTAQIGRFIARSATQLCNHAGLGLGRHAMNLKELHLGPRPRVAALDSAHDLIVSRFVVWKRPRGRRENHETTMHTNTTAYQSPKKPQNWYLPPKYREIKNTVRDGRARRARLPDLGALACLQLKPQLVVIGPQLSGQVAMRVMALWLSPRCCSRPAWSRSIRRRVTLLVREFHHAL